MLLKSLLRTYYELKTFSFPKGCFDTKMRLLGNILAHCAMVNWVLPVTLCHPCFCPTDFRQTHASGRQSKAWDWSQGSQPFVQEEYFASLGGTNPLQQKKTFIRSDLQPQRTAQERYYKDYLLSRYALANKHYHYCVGSDKVSTTLGTYLGIEALTFSR